jgi:hypothetical protein
VLDQTALADAPAENPKLDHVTDFSAAQGDTIDISPLLLLLDVVSYCASELAADVVRAIEDARGAFTTLQISSDVGHGGNQH